MQNTYKTALVIGAGSWGTAIASLLASDASRRVILWTHEQEHALQLQQTRVNSRYLQHEPLAANIEPSADLSLVSQADVVFFVVPTAVMRSVCQRAAAYQLPENCVLVSCSKGIERSSSLRMSQIIAEYFPQHHIAALSGPNHAEEVIKGLPAACVVGCQDMEIARELQSTISTSLFRAYASTDVAGMELGGAIKNVFAIAAGIAEGLGLGDNATAALVTRALAELTRLGCALGGQAETFMGLSGVGDLMVTCYSHHSRNNRVGRALAAGKNLEQILAELGMVAEGVPNTLSIYQAARNLNVRTPIIDAVYAVLYEQVAPATALASLLTRAPRMENED